MPHAARKTTHHVPPTATPTSLALVAALTVSICAGVAAGDENVADEGSVAVSSVFGGNQYPGSLSIDGDRGTSWFSDGIIGGENETYEWYAARPDVVTSINILNNEQNDEGFFGFGFGSVEVLVLDALGLPVFVQEEALPGDTDPNVMIDLPAGTVVSAIFITYTTHDDPACGGFSELEVMADRGALVLGPPSPGRAGEVNTLTAYNGTPGALVYFGYAFSGGSTPLRDCPGVTLDLDRPVLIGSAVVSPDGQASVSSFIPPIAQGLFVNLQVAEIASCRVSNVITTTIE